MADTQSPNKKKLNPGERDYEAKFSMPSGRGSHHDQGVDYDRDAFDDLANNYEQEEFDSIARNNPDLSSRENASATGAASSNIAAREAAGDSGWQTTVSKKRSKSTKMPAVTLQQKLVQWAREKGGIPGAIIAILVIILTIMIPAVAQFKVPSLMDALNKFRGAATEIMTDATGRRIILTAMSTNFGQRRDGPVRYSDDSDFGKLMNEIGEEMRQKFTDNGFEFRQTGGGVEIKWRGRVLGTGNSPDDLGRILDNAPRDIRLQVTESFARAAPVKLWKSRFVANWAKLRYKLPRWGIDEDQQQDDDDQDNNNRTPEERHRQRITEQRARQGYERVLANFGEAVNCILGFGSCPDEGRGPPDDQRPDGEEGDPDDESRREAQDSVNREIAGAADEAADQAGRDAASGRSISTNLMEKITTKIISAAGSKAIPWIGWIDLFATLVVQIERVARGDLIVNMAIRLKTMTSGYMYEEWSGYGDQIKDGKMTPDTAGVLSEQMGSASDSVAFNYMSGNGQAGKDLQESQKINSIYPDGGLAMTMQHAFDGAAFALYSRPDILAGSYMWYYSIGWILRKVGDAVGELAVKAVCAEMGIRSWLLNKVLPGNPYPDCDKMVEMMTEAIKKMLPAMLALLGLIDPMARDAELFNLLDQGGNVTHADWCKENGCRKLTPEEAASQHTRSVAYLEEEFNNLPLHERIFSPTNSKSAFAQLAMITPSIDTSFAGSSMLGFLSKMPSLALGQFSKPLTASASTLDASGVPYVNLWGIEEYGATSADMDTLRSSLPTEYLNGGECPEVNDEGETFNHCVFTKNTSTIVKASITGDDGTGTGSTGGDDVATDKLPSKEELLKPTAGKDCPAGTENRGDHDGYSGGTKIRIRVCEIPNFKSSGAESRGQYGMSGASGGLLVNQNIAGVVKKMADEADGRLRAASGFRTMAHQQALWNQYGSGRAARPGYSNHQLGIAIDVESGYISWFDKNARKYGFKQNSTDCPGGWENWHWSPTGC